MQLFAELQGYKPVIERIKSISIYFDIDLAFLLEIAIILTPFAEIKSMQAVADASSSFKPLCLFGDLTELNKAFADNLRLQVLRLLRGESFGVLELCRILDIRQSALSHHLKILANAKIVSTRREGNSIFYRRALLKDEDPYREIKESILERVDEIPIPIDSKKQIKQIQLERAEQSLSFFRRNSDKFQEKQGLIVEHADYATNLHDVISSLNVTPISKILEVGPGEGELLSELAKKFKSLVALDNSKQMLDKCRTTISIANCKGVEFLLGDTSAALDKNIKSDLIIFNMVLHHISSPAKSFKDASALLNSGGNLLIVDLSRHDQDWVRGSCGDLWLGFEEADLNHWASKAKLAIGQSSYLSLRNGFQIQMRVFNKNS